MNFTSDSNDVSPKLLLGVLLAAVFESYTHFRESEEEFVKRVRVPPRSVVKSVFYSALCGLLQAAPTTNLSCRPPSSILCNSAFPVRHICFSCCFTPVDDRNTSNVSMLLEVTSDTASVFFVDYFCTRVGFSMTRPDQILGVYLNLEISVQALSLDSVRSPLCRR